MLGITGIWSLGAVLCLLSGKFKCNDNLPHQDFNHLGVGNVAQMKCLPSMYEALGSIP